MYKTPQSKRIGKNKPGKYKLIYQGQIFQNIKNSTYWFYWGEYLFDIRVIRRFFEVEEFNPIDKEPFTLFNFKKRMQEIVNLVDEQNFETVLICCLGFVAWEREQKKGEANGS